MPTSIERYNIKDVAAKNQVDTLRQNVKEHNILFFDFDSNQGIVHVIGPELGITQPGMTIVCGDSHTSTHGAFGALAFGIGTSELTQVLATNCLLLTKPKVMRVEFQGQLQKGVFAKDMIMKLIAEIGINGATGFIIEYAGDIISQMSMEERMTICNMSIECGARAGLISPDETTFSYLKNRCFSPPDGKWNDAVSYWQSLKSDVGCTYDLEVLINVANLKPMVSWGTNPAQAVEIVDSIPDPELLKAEDKLMAIKALDYMQLEANQKMQTIPIDWAFVGSCTNGRIEELRIVAQILKIGLYIPTSQW